MDITSSIHNFFKALGIVVFCCSKRVLSLVGEESSLFDIAGQKKVGIDMHIL